MTEFNNADLKLAAILARSMGDVSVSFSKSLYGAGRMIAYTNGGLSFANMSIAQNVLGGSLEIRVSTKIAHVANFIMSIRGADALTANGRGISRVISVGVRRDDPSGISFDDLVELYLTSVFEIVSRRYSESDDDAILGATDTLFFKGMCDERTSEANGRKVNHSVSAETWGEW